MNLTPEPGEHALCVGKTGSGKTTTSTAILSQVSGVYPILMMDSKGDQKLEKVPGARIVTKPSELTFEGTELYRPDGQLNDAEYLDLVLQKAFLAKRSMYVYVDELYQVSNQAKPGQGLANLLMRGRHRSLRGRSVRISTLMSSQRPAWIPRHCGTEATHFYIHSLMESDRKRMSEYTGERCITDDPVTGHEFWYYKHGMSGASRLQLNIERKAEVG